MGDVYKNICMGMIIFGLLITVVCIMSGMQSEMDSSHYINKTVPCYDRAWNEIQNVVCFEQEYISDEPDLFRIIIGSFGFIFFITGVLFDYMRDEKPKYKII